MKKILFFATLIAICSAFALINSNKKQAVANVKLAVEEKMYPESEAISADDNVNTSFTGKVTFEQLLKQFPKGTLPYSLTTNMLREELTTMSQGDATTKVERHSLKRAFLRFLPLVNDNSMFSRMPMPLPEPFLAFETNGKHILVYFTQGYSSYKTYYVSTFTNTGKVISEKQLSHVGLSSIVDATINENLDLTRFYYTVIWNKKPDKNGYKNAKIVELKLTKKTTESLLNKDVEKENKIEKNTTERVNP